MLFVRRAALKKDSAGLLNIVGAVLFLRLSWAVGQSGFWGVVLMLTLGTVQTTLTALSMSALISNGMMRGGGGYYIISRAVGPELGGAIGVCFYFCYSFGCGFYLVSFTESFVEAVFPHNDWSYYGIHALTASIGLWTCILIGLIGAHCFTKVNVPLFIVQFGCIAWGFVSILATPDPCKSGLTPAPGFACGDLLCTNSSATYVCGQFHGWKWDNFVNNAWASFTSVNCDHLQCSWLVVYSVVFTAVTGIFEGANLSGDLRDPNRHIWRGTLIAIWGAYLTYMLCIIGFAGGFDRATLQQNYYVFQQTSFGSPWIVIVGVWVACYTSGLGGLMGGSRILQALARDNLFPGLWVFGRGFGSGDEPRLAILLTGAIAQLAILIGDVNTIAPIITTFFCLAYSLVNMSLLLVYLSGTPNFRPRFKYWHWSTALLGFALNFGVMWALSWLYSLVACVIFVALVLWLSYGYVPNKNIEWGDARTALIFHQIRKFLLKLNLVQQRSGKLWRPSVLFFLHDQTRQSLLQVCNYLKRGGVYVVGDVLVSSDPFEAAAVKQLARLQQGWDHCVMDAKIKAFSSAVVAPSARHGYHALATTAGLGALSPNTVVLPWPWTLTACASAEEYVNVMRDVVLLGKNLAICCNVGPDYEATQHLEPKWDRYLDVFIYPHVKLGSWKEFADGSLGLMTVAWSLVSRRVSIRLFKMLEASQSSSSEAIAEARERIVDVVKRQGRFRIGKRGAGIHVVSEYEEPRVVGNPMERQYWESLNAVIARRVSPATSMVFLPMVEFRGARPADDVIASIDALVRGLGPTVLVQQSQSGSELMSRTL